MKSGGFDAYRNTSLCVFFAHILRRTPPISRHAPGAKRTTVQLITYERDGAEVEGFFSLSSYDGTARIYRIFDTLDSILVILLRSRFTRRNTQKRNTHFCVKCQSTMGIVGGSTDRRLSRGRLFPARTIDALWRTVPRVNTSKETPMTATRSPTMESIITSPPPWVQRNEGPKQVR